MARVARNIVRVRGTLSRSGAITNRACSSLTMTGTSISNGYTGRQSREADRQTGRQGRRDACGTGAGQATGGQAGVTPAVRWRMGRTRETGNRNLPPHVSSGAVREYGRDGAPYSPSFAISGIWRGTFRECPISIASAVGHNPFVQLGRASVRQA